MTDLMQKRGEPEQIHWEPPATVDPPAAEPAPVPAAGKDDDHSGWLSRLTIGHYVSIVGGLLVTLVILTGVAFALVVSWMATAVDESGDWAATQARLDYVHELVTQQYVETTQALRDAFGLSFVIEENSLEIAAEIDTLLSDLHELTADPVFTELGSELHGSNATLTATAVEGVESARSGGQINLAIMEVELGFADWRRHHREFATAIGEGQAAALAQHSSRAGVATAAVIVLGALALTVLSGAWYLGRQARRKERTLQRELAAEKELLTTVMSQLPESIAWKDSELNLVGCNDRKLERFRSFGLEDPIGTRISDADLSPYLTERVAYVEGLEAEVIASGTAILGRQETEVPPDGPERTIVRSIVPLIKGDQVIGMVSTVRDVSEVVALERSLAAATRLESIGQLAAGIAHEINTPVQFVSDNTAFLAETFGELIAATNELSEIAARQDADKVEAVRKQADLEFLLEEIPDAVSQSREGLEQIATIVRAMKDFAHPGGDAGPTDVNRLVRSVVEVSKNEWKYDADMQVELADELPEPHCDGGQIKQVVLNMVVNAAHAIADSDRERGTITVATSSDESSVYISISDDGAGIPDEVRPRIFERFFTTKEVGRGSGQGLAIAYDAVKSHGGEIHVESKIGVGTTFTVELPIEPPAE